NPDCSASGDVTIRVTKQPEHGTAEIAAATLFPSFEKENIRFKCNQHKVRGQQVNYKSAEKYTAWLWLPPLGWRLLPSWKGRIGHHRVRPPCRFARVRRPWSAGAGWRRWRG